MTTDLDTLLTALYVLVDDHVIDSGPPRRGHPRRLADSELVRLAVAQVLLGARSEHHWLRMCYGRLGHLFPYLPKQPGYHKRLKAAAPLICKSMLALAALCPSWDEELRLLDATPVPCGTSRQTVRRSELAGWASYGYCAAHSRWYWELKLYLLTTAEGMPVAWCMASPRLGEREVAQELLERASEEGTLRAGMIVLADKGLAGRDIERFIAGELKVLLARPDRKDQTRRAPIASAQSRGVGPAAPRAAVRDASTGPGPARRLSLVEDWHAGEGSWLRWAAAGRSVSSSWHGPAAPRVLPGG